tara:strand:+ start:206 stop:418 length:213 start_codon:yes stop_codon:yes gene_type:complete
VGGLEAEAVMCGQQISMVLPQVVGYELVGELPAGATSTDLVLTVTEVNNESLARSYNRFGSEGMGSGYFK